MGGCGLYRQFAPHMNLARNHKDTHVTFTEGLEHFEVLTGEKLSSYDIVHYHKGYYSESGLSKARREGLVTVVDFDDYWHVPYGQSNSSFKDKYTLSLFGYQRGSIFDNYCDVLTDKGKWVSNFHLYPAESAEKYTLYYNLLDVALVPLVDNRFNNLKSELKLIEAGFFKKAAIVSDIMPYSPLIRHGENCLAVRKQGDWFKHIKYLIANPQEAKRLGENLYETVKEKYNQNNVSEDRYNLYKCLIAERSKQRGAA